MSNKLINWRKEIDALDEELLHILARRMEIVRRIGKFKKSHDILPLDEMRWNEVLASKLALAELLKLPRTVIEKIYVILHEEALKIEEEE